MTIVNDFEYYKARSLEEAWILKSELKNAAILAGGTDLICNLKEEREEYSAIIDIKGISNLNSITYKNGILNIGTLVTFSDLIKSEIIHEHFPLIMEASKTVASVAIRNRATMAGNICSAVPCMDSAPVLLVYDAKIIVTGLDGERRIPIENWFKSPRRTAIKSSEILTSIEIEKPKEKTEGVFVKLGRYRGEDLAQANLAVLSSVSKNYKIAFGSVGPIPIRLKKVEEKLKGKKIDLGILKECNDLILKSISPISDIRASKEYREHMSQIMFERAMIESVKRIQGEGRPYGTQII